jgi:hypothetical protein
MIRKIFYVSLMIALGVMAIAFGQSAKAEIALTEARFYAGDPAASANFGAAIATDGAMAVVGAPGAGGTGAAYVFEYAGGAWTESAKLSPSDGMAADQFGASVAIQGGTIVVGAPGNDEAAGNGGAAYVFTGGGAAWTEGDKLLPSDVSDHSFGFSVDLDGDTIAVGGPYHDSGTTNSGAVYIFNPGSSGWEETVRLATNTGGAVLSDLFGWDVALSGDLLVVGAYLADTAYLYTLEATGWEPAGELSGDDTAVGDRFGHAGEHRRHAHYGRRHPERRGGQQCRRGIHLYDGQRRMGPGDPAPAVGQFQPERQQLRLGCGSFRQFSRGWRT